MIQLKLPRKSVQQKKGSTKDKKINTLGRCNNASKKEILPKVSNTISIDTKERISDFKLENDDLDDILQDASYAEERLLLEDNSEEHELNKQVEADIVHTNTDENLLNDKDDETFVTQYTTNADDMLIEENKNKDDQIN